MAAHDDPKTLGRSRLSFADERDIDEFATTLDRFERGKIPARRATVALERLAGFYADEHRPNESARRSSGGSKPLMSSTVSSSSSIHRTSACIIAPRPFVPASRLAPGAGGDNAARPRSAGCISTPVRESEHDRP